MFAAARDLFNYLVGNNYPSRTELAKLKTASTQTDARAPPTEPSPVTTVAKIYPVAEWTPLSAEMF